MLDTQKIKKDFPIFENFRRDTGLELSYLDSAASSQTPKSVIDAMDEYYTKYRSNVHRSFYQIGAKATERYEGARAVVARFLGAGPDEIIFTSGATLGINMLVYSLEHSLDWKEGDEIVTTLTEHHSNLVPFQELAKRKGLVLKHVGVTPDYELDYDSLDSVITERTKVVSIPLASNVLGTINEAKRVADAAHAKGALFILDASKAAGHIAIDVGSLGADFLYFSAHKMGGPTGTGVLYARRDALLKLEPSFFGGGIVNKADAQSASWKEGPLAFEAGTPNVAGVIGLAAAIEYLEGIGLDAVRAHSEEMVAYGMEKLGSLPGVRIYSHRNPKKNVGIISFTVEGVHPHDVAEVLGEQGIALRGGHHCAMPLMIELDIPATVRASFYVYSSKEDIDRLVHGITSVQDMFLKR